MGILLILLSAVGFGSMALLATVAYEGGVDTATLLMLRFVIAAVLLGSLMCARGVRAPRGRALANCVGMGLAYAMMAWAYFSALHYAPSATVALVLYVYPILVALAAAALRMDRFGLAESVSLVVSSTGLCLVLGGALDGAMPGFLLALVSALCYSAYILMGSRHVGEVDAIASSATVLTVAAACYLLLTLWQGPHWPPQPRAWMATVGVAILGTAVAIAAFIAGLKRVGPTLAAVLSTLEPVVTVGLGVWFLGEQPTWAACVGGGLILVAAIGLAVARNRRAATRRGTHTDAVTPPA
ncbi:MAG: DMT family transporter [Proteobacteria bacterium]|nr:DMT family transporter [Pseudomonadota bacterium]